MHFILQAKTRNVSGVPVILMNDALAFNNVSRFCMLTFSRFYYSLFISYIIMHFISTTLKITELFRINFFFDHYLVVNEDFFTKLSLHHVIN